MLDQFYSAEGHVLVCRWQKNMLEAREACGWPTVTGGESDGHLSTRTPPWILSPPCQGPQLALTVFNLHNSEPHISSERKPIKYNQELFATQSLKAQKGNIIDGDF